MQWVIDDFVPRRFFTNRLHLWHTQNSLFESLTEDKNESGPINEVEIARSPDDHLNNFLPALVRRYLFYLLHICALLSIFRHYNEPRDWQKLRNRRIEISHSIFLCLHTKMSQCPDLNGKSRCLETRLCKQTSWPMINISCTRPELRSQWRNSIRIKSTIIQSMLMVNCSLFLLFTLSFGAAISLQLNW